MSGLWQVKAFENFGAPRESDLFDLGACDTEEQAVAYAKHHVRKSLEEYAQVSFSVNDLISQFEAFGEEAVVFSPDGVDRCEFSARDFAHSIAREVFQSQQKTLIDPELRSAYRQTHYVASLPSGEALIEVGKRSLAVDAWLQSVGPSTALFLTAWNPMSYRLSAEENARRHEQLLARVREGGFSFVDAVGRSPDGEWSEQSLLIAGVGYDVAQDLAHRFEQAAFVWLARGRFASLRIRSTVLHWVEEADLA
jgi:hypothetical protein